MKIDKIYDEIKKYEIEEYNSVLENTGDLYIQENKQLFKHFLDNITYNLEENNIVFFSPELNKYFRIPDNNIKGINPLEYTNDINYSYSFWYGPLITSNINEEYIWNEDNLMFFLENVRKGSDAK